MIHLSAGMQRSELLKRVIYRFQLIVTKTLGFCVEAVGVEMFLQFVHVVVEND